MQEFLAAQDNAKQKQRCRSEWKKRCALLTDAYRKQADADILRKLVSMPEYRNSGQLLSYVSMPGEPDTRELIRLALAMGKHVAVPLCSPSDCKMEFRAIKSMEQLAPGAYGIPEPAGGTEKVLGDGGLLIVPALCFDRNCGRLGRGKGYYDRFLAGFKGFTVGLCYGKMLSEEPLPRENFDLPVQAVVTEKEIMYNNIDASPQMVKETT